jgi:hypothetical protein
MKGVSPEFGNWVAGFADGEGCFWVNNHKRDQHFCGFRIKLRVDDEAILEEIRDALGIGTMCYPTFRPVGNSNPAVCWQVQSRPECLDLVNFFDKYPLRTKKREVYLIWREAVLAWSYVYNGGSKLKLSGNRDVWAYMAECKREIEAVTRFAP